ncbi:MAG: HAD family phosphatase [Bacteroidetes bacterium]|nr:HAD family phosphatase [Bacteroidota bacterium]
MLNLSSRIPNHSSIKNIIFDFGGVICDLEISRSVEKFKEFGPAKAGLSGNQEEQDREFEKLVATLETGLITSQQFREVIRFHYQVPPSDAEIDDAWNALLAGIPEPRIRVLENIRSRYRIFLLSNSNEIHFLKFRADLQEKYGYAGFEELFERACFSYQVHLKKPDPAIFQLVLTENKLVSSETLFIDDTLIHVEAARKLGINGYHLREGENLTMLFDKP